MLKVLVGDYDEGSYREVVGEVVEFVSGGSYNTPKMIVIVNGKLQQFDIKGQRVVER